MELNLLNKYRFAAMKKFNKNQVVFTIIVAVIILSFVLQRTLRGF